MTLNFGDHAATCSSHIRRSAMPAWSSTMAGPPPLTSKFKRAPLTSANPPLSAVEAPPSVAHGRQGVPSVKRAERLFKDGDGRLGRCLCKSDAVHALGGESKLAVPPAPRSPGFAFRRPP